MRFWPCKAMATMDRVQCCALLPCIVSVTGVDLSMHCYSSIVIYCIQYTHHFSSIELGSIIDCVLACSVLTISVTKLQILIDLSFSAHSDEPHQDRE